MLDEVIRYEEPLLTVDHVSMEIGGRIILRDVCAQIRNIVRVGKTQGQVVGFLGPSGRGKTTLFRLMAGLLEPTKGRVLVGPDQQPTSPGRVGVVAQHYPLLYHRTIGENLLIAAMRAGVPAAEARFRGKYLLGRFGLDDRWDDWPRTLSGGQRQRVAVIQQILCSETTILMDEPLSGLDLIAKNDLCALITQIAAMHEHCTIVVVTHDIASAVKVADCLWLLGHARAEDGSILEGSTIRHTINLVDRGLPWQPNIETLPAYAATIREIEALFPQL